MRILTLLLLAGCTTTSSGGSKPQEAKKTTLYVVRHAEKVDSSDNAMLNERGTARAEALATQLADVHIDAIYSTRYKRTAQTVWPTATAKGIEVVTKTPRARLLLQKHRGQTVLVAGHSNTVPELIRQLGVREPVVIGHQDYGDLFVVTVDDAGKARLERRRFGDT